MNLVVKPVEERALVIRETGGLYAQFTNTTNWLFTPLQVLYRGIASYLAPKQTLRLDCYKIEREGSVVLASVKKVDDYAVRRLGGDSAKNKSAGLTKLDYLKLAIVGAGLAIASTDESSLATTVAAGASFLSVWALSINRAFILPMASAQGVNNSTYPNLVFYIDQPNSFSMPLKDIFGMDNITFNQVLNWDNSTSPIDFSFVSGAYNAPWEPTAAALNGNLVYVLDQTLGLQIIDVTDPTHPTLKGLYPNSGYASSVVVQGDFAYIPDIFIGLQIIDVSNPSLPILKGTYKSSAAFSVAVSGDLAYLGDGSEGLLIIDVTNPVEPILKGTYAKLENSIGIVVRGNFAYVADGLAGLKILDVSNSSMPILVGTYNTSAAVISINKNLAYVTGTGKSLNCLNIIDISNPSLPVLKGKYNTPAISFAFNGNLVYLAAALDGLKIMDVTNPSEPILKERYNTQGSAFNVDLKGNFAYVVSAGFGLQVIDFSHLSFLQTPSVQDRGLYHLKVFGSNSFVNVFNDFKLTVSEQISIKSNKPSEFIPLSSYGNLFESIFYPLEIFRYEGVKGFLDLKLRGVTTLPAWLEFKKSALITSGYDTGGVTSAVFVRGLIAYVLVDSALQIIDVSDPTLPILKAAFDSSKVIRTVFVSGNLAYIAVQNGDLQIIDVSNPTEPILKGTFLLSKGITNIFVQGNLTYVSDSFVGLQIIDAANPSEPILKGRYVIPEGAESVFVFGNMAYLTGGTPPSLYIVDITDTSQMVLKGTCVLLNPAQSVFVFGNMAYIGCHNKGLQIIDVSDPSMPVLKGTYNTGGYAQKVVVIGNIAYVADGVLGLQVIDVSDPTTPVLKDTYNTPGVAYGLAVSGTIVYVADRQKGLQIIDFSKNYYTLSGTPSAEVAGNYEFQVACFNDLGLSRNSFFLLRIEGAPVVNGTMGAQVAFVGQVYNAIIKQGIFVDPNEDSLTFSAQLSNGRDLPLWLRFSPTGIFLGTPKPSDIGESIVRVKAEDGHEGSAFIDVPLTVTNAPLVANPIADQTFNVGQNFSLTFPSNTFVDLDGDAMNYTARKATSLPLPDWLAFNGTTFSGVSWNVSRTSIDLEATEIHGGKAHAYFDLVIAVIINKPPVLMIRMSDKVINVLENFQFSLPTDMFKDPDGDPITLIATMEDGTPLPFWIKFDAIEKVFSGRAERAQTNNFAPRDYRFSVIASDGDKKTESTFRLQVDGESDLARGLKMTGYALSVLSTLFAFYKQRARIWNVIGKRSYRADSVKAGIGEHFSCQLSQRVTSCFVKRLDSQEVSLESFFNDEIKFNSKNNCIEGVPSLINRGEYTIVAYNKFGVLSRVFILDIDAAQREMLLYSIEGIPLSA